MARTRSTPAQDPPAAGRADLWERRAALFAALLLGFLLIQGLAFIGEASQTSDEAAHLAAGYSYLTTADFRLNPEHPPLIKEIAALPLLPLGLDFPSGSLWDMAEEWNIGRIFVHENRLPNDTILFLARLPILLLSLLLGWGLFHWGRRLFGPRAALCSLALYALDPNVVAHSGLVTTDLGVTLFMFFTVHALWRWSERPAPRTLLLAGLMAGGAFASKFTAFWLLPILAALGAVLLATPTALPRRPWSARSAPAPGTGPAPRRLLSLALAALVMAGVAFVVVLITYAGRGLPAFAAGLDRGLRHSAAGHTGYLMGRLSETGWWYYFLLAYAIKTPIGTLLIVAAAVVGALRGRRRSLKDEAFLWLPVLITLAITCLWKVNIGLRHLLPIYPFLYLAAGRVAAPAGGPPGAAGAAGASVGRLANGALIACLVWNFFAAWRIAPDYLAYFNEIIGGPRNGHLWLLDSNLDWGQSSKALRRFMMRENVNILYCAFSGNSDPWYDGVGYQYVPGSGNLDNAKGRSARVPDGTRPELLAVSAMVLHSVHFTDHSLYDWLKARPAVAMPGYSYLVYDITGDAEAHSYIAVLCLNFGLLDLAEFEARRALRITPGNSLARAVLDKIREYEAGGGAPSPPGGEGRRP